MGRIGQLPAAAIGAFEHHETVAPLQQRRCLKAVVVASRTAEWPRFQPQALHQVGEAAQPQPIETLRLIREDLAHHLLRPGRAQQPGQVLQGDQGTAHRLIAAAVEGKGFAAAAGVGQAQVAWAEGIGQGRCFRQFADNPIVQADGYRVGVEGGGCLQQLGGETQPTPLLRAAAGLPEPALSAATGRCRPCLHGRELGIASWVAEQLLQLLLMPGAMQWLLMPQGEQGLGQFAGVGLEHHVLQLGQLSQQREETPCRNGGHHGGVDRQGGFAGGGAHQTHPAHGITGTEARQREGAAGGVVADQTHAALLDQQHLMGQAVGLEQGAPGAVALPLHLAGQLPPQCGGGRGQPAAGVELSQAGGHGGGPGSCRRSVSPEAGAAASRRCRSASSQVL